MKVRLYDEHDKYNNIGDELDREIHRAIKGIIAKYVGENYSPRDIQNVTQGAVLDIILMHLCGYKDK